MQNIQNVLTRILTRSLVLLGVAMLICSCEETSDLSSFVEWRTTTSDSTSHLELKVKEHVLHYTTSAASSLLVCPTAWRIADVESLPDWLTITPTSGVGNAILYIRAAENKLAVPRIVEVNFCNEALNEVAVMTIFQIANPEGVENKYLYLGWGYDASDRYAEEVSLRGKVLDEYLLIEGEHVAELLNSNSTIEEVVTGKTLSEYESNFAQDAGVEGEIAGFSSSIKTNFSQKALGTSEYSYATLRHITKKQIYKIYENETAEELKACRSDIFLNDMEEALAVKDDPALFETKANGLLDKYGTHVIAGFSLGGVLDYSMAADVSMVEESIDWGLAVQAGFEEEGTGKVSASSNTTQFDRLKNESNGFESKLLCRGGESQYVSSGYGEDAGKTAASYEEWLSSLEDEEKWVLVDFEGRKLIGISDFVDDEDLKAVLVRLSAERRKSLSLEQKSNYKQLEIRLVNMWSNQDDAGDEQEWAFKLATVVDKKSSTARTLIHITNPIDVPENKTFSLEKYNATSGIYKLTFTQTHSLAIKLTDCYEEDSSSLDNDNVPDTTLELTYSTLEGWSYLGTYGDEKNKTIYLNDSGTINLYATDDTGSKIRFTFQMTWQ